MANRKRKEVTSAQDNPHQLPSQYEFLQVMGEGSFGKVLKCLKKDTKDIVAIKIINEKMDLSHREASILDYLMKCELDHLNIVKYFGCFEMSHGKALVFEMLDISLFDYMSEIKSQMVVSDIRLIIRQLAEALEALKLVKMIHTDIKPDNIMLVDRRDHPIRVKLIDFGLAIPSTNTRPGRKLQALYYRSPEIILGLPFSEAIDMWSLGCVMAEMILNYPLFPGEDEYQAIQFMVELLGQPADHLLDKGIRTSLYFNRTDSKGWRLKTPVDYWSSLDYPWLYLDHRLPDWRRYKFRSLDDMARRLKWRDDEQTMFIELLKDMLKMDPAERCTPMEVPNYPLNAEEWQTACLLAGVNNIFDDKKNKKNCFQRFFSWRKKGDNTICPDHRSPSPTIPRPVVIKVQPDAPENTEFEDQESASSFTSYSAESAESSLKYTTSQTDEDSTTSDDTDITKKKKNLFWRFFSWMKKRDIIVHQSPTIPRPVVIKVQPAAPENRTELEDQESASSLQDELKNMSESSLKVIECDTAPQTTEDSTTSNDTGTTKWRKKKNLFRRCFSLMKQCDITIHPSPTIPRRVVIKVQPAAELEDQESASSLTFYSAESTESLLKHTAPQTNEDSTTSNYIRTRKKEKKKSCFQRCCSWMMKKKF